MTALRGHVVAFFSYRRYRQASDLLLAASVIRYFLLLGFAGRVLRHWLDHQSG